MPDLFSCVASVGPFSKRTTESISRASCSRSNTEKDRRHNNNIILSLRTAAHVIWKSYSCPRRCLREESVETRRVQYRCPSAVIGRLGIQETRSTRLPCAIISRGPCDHSVHSSSYQTTITTMYRLSVSVVVTCCAALSLSAVHRVQVSPIYTCIVLRSA